MEEPVTNQEGLSSTFSRIFNSLLIFLITFSLANIFHQLVLGACSKFFSYETVIGFGNVHSYPTDNHAWSTPRVLFIYTMPLILCVLLTLIVFYRFFVSRIPKRDIISFFAFWMVINLLLVMTTYMSIAPLGEMNHKYLYQDLSVIGSWFGIGSDVLLIFSGLGVIINLLFGSILAKELLRFAYLGRWQDRQSGRFYLFRTYFLFPLILGVPSTLFFSYPDSTFFHIFMAMHAFLFVPAIYFNYKNTDPVDVDMADSDFIGKPKILLPIIFIFLVLVVRIFFTRE